MAYFKLTAEHVARRQAFDAMAAWESAGIQHPAVWMDETFTNFFHAVLEGTSEDARAAQRIVYGLNGGAFCSVEQVTEAEVENYL